MENSQQQARWYVLHTYSGYESMVMENLHKLIENNNLQDVILDIVIPEEQVVEEKRGKKKVVKRKMYPCYVFVKLVYSNELWYLLTNTRGVTGFVGPSGRALPSPRTRSEDAPREGCRPHEFHRGRQRARAVGPP